MINLELLHQTLDFKKCDLLTDWLTDRTEFRDAIASKKTLASKMVLSNLDNFWSCILRFSWQHSWLLQNQWSFISNSFYIYKSGRASVHVAVQLQWAGPLSGDSYEEFAGLLGDNGCGQTRLHWCHLETHQVDLKVQTIVGEVTIPTFNGSVIYCSSRNVA